MRIGRPAADTRDMMSQLGSPFGPEYRSARRKADQYSRPIEIEALRVIPLFREFESAELDALAELVVSRKYRKHEFIVREGEPGKALFAVISGSVAVVRTTVDGRETILSILKAREFFGEMSVFDESPRAASVRAMTDVEVGMIAGDDVLELIDRRPRVGRVLVCALAERLRAANAQISAASSQDIRARLAALLLNLVTSFGEKTDAGVKISLRLTNQEMANMIGTTRETVNRTLNKFWDERVIDMRTSHVVVVDQEKLASFIG